MTVWAIAFAATAAAFLVCDMIWLGSTVSTLYRPVLGSMLADRPNLPAAGLFYLVYITGILILAVRPALKDHSLLSAALLGAVLGFVAYGTYDLTNMATLRGWPAKLTVIDLIWGTLLTSAASCAGYWAATLARGAA